MADEDKTTTTPKSKKKDEGFDLVTLSDPKRAEEHAKAQGINTEGLSLEPFDNSALQEAEDEIQERGYLGHVPDPTPNENYTVAGVTSGAPTPETDADLYNEAQAAALGNPREAIDISSAQVAKVKKDRSGS